MDDKQIVQLYLDRNKQAVSATAEKYGNSCTEIAKNILGDKEEAAECVNDAYLKAWNSIPPHNPKSLSVFLGNITRDLAIKRYKEKFCSKQDGDEVAMILEEIAEFVSDTEEHAVDLEELFEAINGFLATLNEEKRNIFVCRYWYLNSITHIAERFGISESKVKIILLRCRNQLREYLIKEGYRL